MPTLEQEAEAMKLFIAQWKAIATMQQAFEQSSRSCETLLKDAMPALEASFSTPDGKFRTDIPEWQLVRNYKCADFIWRTTQYYMQQAAGNGKAHEQIWEEGWKAFLLALKTFPPIMDGDIAEMENMPEAARLYGRLSRAGHVCAHSKIYPRTKRALQHDYNDIREGLRTEVLKLAPNAWARWQPTTPSIKTGNTMFAKLREMIVHDIEEMAGDDPEREQLLRTAVETGILPVTSAKVALDIFVKQEQAAFRDILKHAHLSEHEQQIIDALLDEHDLLEYGGNKELAERLGRPAGQIGVEKHSAFKKVRTALKKHAPERL